MDLFHDFCSVLISIILEATPFVVIGSLVSGMIEVFLPAEWVQRVVPRNRVLAAVMGALGGLAMPMCECGIVPVLRRLLRKGVPLHAAIAYMLAAPIVNPIVLASTLFAFRQMRPIEVAGFRAVLGMCVAIAAGLAVAALAGRESLKPFNSLPEPDHSERTGRLGAALRHAGSDFIEVAAFLFIGSAVAAALNVFAPRDAIESFAGHPVMAALAAMALAVALNLCSEADAFVAYSLRGFSIAARLAFLVLGPMLDVKLIAMYTRVFRRRTILILCATTTALVFAAIMILGLLRPDLADPALATPTPVKAIREGGR